MALACLPAQEPDALQTAPPADVRRLPPPSSCAEFATIARAGEPVLLEGLVRDWPCFERWTDAYLLRKLAGRKFLVSVSEDGLFGIYSSRMLDGDRLLHLTFAEFLERVHRHGDSGDGGLKHYLQQKPMAQAFPELLADVTYPSFVDRTLLTQVNLWIGQRASRIPLHYDTFDNLLAQVRGEKAIRLYGPWHTPDLYPGLDGAEFASHVDPERPDYARHPRFRRVRAEHELVLREGDCLVLPPFWWHSVRALTNANISINYWYDTAFGEPRAPLAATRDLLRIALDEIRRLPGQQRLQALRDADRGLSGLREAVAAAHESRPGV